MLELEVVTQEDLPSIAKLHKQVFSATHFTSFFSEALLCSYYRCFFATGISFIKAVEQGKIVGFLVCGENIGEKIALFKNKNKFDLLMTAFTNPFPAVRRIVSGIFYRLFQGCQKIDEDEFLILSIASDQSNKGIGKSLLRKADELGLSANMNWAGLYVRVENIRAINFYLMNGYSIVCYNCGQYYMKKALI